MPPILQFCQMNRLLLTSKRPFLRFLLLLGYLLTSPALFAQTLTALDRATYEPIPGVVVYTADFATSVRTNAKGKADLSGFATADTLFLQHPTYKPERFTLAQLEAQGYTAFLSEKVLDLDAVVVSASKWEQELTHVPNQIAEISAKEIAFENPQTSADVLASSGQVFVQKSQMGGGSPMLRGFAANSVLLVVDGVRMNNAIFRSGNLQNVILVDPHLLESAEVVFGPGSVLYGSDALGGVMDFHSRDPEFSEVPGEWLFFGSSLLRYASANNENTFHADMNIASARLAWLGSVTYSSFGDLRAGANRPPFIPDFGERTEYAARENGQDVIRQNSDPDVQIGTAYDQWNISQQLRFQAAEQLALQYTLHYSTSSDVPRYDRLIQRDGDGQLRNAEWYYGPQQWQFHALKAAWKPDAAFADQVRIIASHQRVDEDRIDRRFGNPSRRTRQEDVYTYGLNVDADKSFGKQHQLFYGAEVLRNEVYSSAFREDIETGEVTPTATRYPDGGSLLHGYAAYLSYKWYVNEQLTLLAGARYSLTQIEANFESEQFFAFPFEEATVDAGAVNGSLGLTWRPEKRWQVNLCLASGFRAPNVDDIGKVFESGNGQVVVPNPDLRPETVYTAELGLRKVFAGQLEIGLLGYYSWLTDAMVRRNTTFNGQDSLLFNDQLSQVQHITNAAEAFVWGVNAFLKADITDAFALRSTYTFTEGEDTTEGLPLRHVPPAFGQTEITYTSRKFRGQVGLRYHGWKPISDFAPAEREKTELYTEFGSPSWWVLDLKASYQLSPAIQLNAGVENLLDRHYRPYSSGISAPGRNLFLAVRSRF